MPLSVAAFMHNQSSSPSWIPLSSESFSPYSKPIITRHSLMLYIVARYMLTSSDHEAGFTGPLSDSQLGKAKATATKLKNKKRY